LSLYDSVKRVDIEPEDFYPHHMELHLQDRQSAELAILASRTGRTPDELVEEAVDRLLAQDAWFGEQVQVAIDQIARGEFLSEEEMDVRVARMLNR